MTEGTSPPLVPSVTFEFEGVQYTAVSDHMMIVRYEQIADRSFAYMLLHIERIERANEMPKFSEFGYLLQAMLAEHHPDIDLGVAIKMAAQPYIMDHIATMLGQALNTKDGDKNRPLAKAAT